MALEDLGVVTEDVEADSGLLRRPVLETVDLDESRGREDARSGRGIRDDEPTSLLLRMKAACGNCCCLPRRSAEDVALIVLAVYISWARASVDKVCSACIANGLTVTRSTTVDADAAMPHDGGVWHGSRMGSRREPSCPEVQLVHSG